MSRYIDADRLKTDFAGTLVALERKPKFDGLQIILIRCVFDMIGKIVDNAPTVDAVKVVRCGECKYYDKTGCVADFGWCKRNGSGHGSTDDWFCADGERKEDEQIR